MLRKWKKFPEEQARIGDYVRVDRVLTALDVLKARAVNADLNRRMDGTYWDGHAEGQHEAFLQAAALIREYLEHG